MEKLLEKAIWTNEVLADPTAYKNAMFKLLAHADRAYRTKDGDKLRRVQERMHESHYLATTSPFLGYYQYGMCMVSLLRALYLCDKRHFDRALEICEFVHTIECESDQCRERLRAAARPTCEVTTLLLNVLGDIKWQTPDRYRDLILSPEMMIERWMEISERALAHVATRFQHGEQRGKDIRDSLAWSGLQVIKTATRYCPSRVPGLIALFNLRFGKSLARDAGHIRTAAPVSDQPFYFDYEYVKLRLRGPEAWQSPVDHRRELLEVWARRAESYRAAMIPMDLAAGFASEAELNSLRSKLEVLRAS